MLKNTWCGFNYELSGQNWPYLYAYDRTQFPYHFAWSILQSTETRGAIKLPFKFIRFFVIHESRIISELNCQSNYLAHLGFLLSLLLQSDFVLRQKGIHVTLISNQVFLTPIIITTRFSWPFNLPNEVYISCCRDTRP